MRALITLFVSATVATAAHAGAWGDGSFENDDALDWVAKCTQSNGIAPVAQILHATLAEKYIEAPLGSAAVAAAEIVAAALGKPSAKLPPNVQSWVHKQSSVKLSRLAPLAKNALTRIQDPKMSELQQLWSEGKPNSWSEGIADLEARLGRRAASHMRPNPSFQRTASGVR